MLTDTGHRVYHVATQGYISTPVYRAAAGPLRAQCQEPLGPGSACQQLVPGRGAMNILLTLRNVQANSVSVFGAEEREEEKRGREKKAGTTQARTGTRRAEAARRRAEEEKEEEAEVAGPLTETKSKGVKPKVAGKAMRKKDATSEDVARKPGQRHITAAAG